MSVTAGLSLGPAEIRQNIKFAASSSYDFAVILTAVGLCICKACFSVAASTFYQDSNQVMGSAWQMLADVPKLHTPLAFSSRGRSLPECGGVLQLQSEVA